MKKLLTMTCAALLGFALTIGDADAKRLGGGGSKGMQRDSVTQRQATPAPAAPAQQAAPQAAPQQPAAAGAAAQPKRNWLGPLAGLAAGIGLAALLSHFGLGEGVANFLMILLLVMAAIFVVKLLLRRKEIDRGPMSEPMRYAGVGGPGMAPVPPAPSEPTVSGSAAPLTPAAAVIPRAIPADFDTDGFLRVAKVNFLRLQAAHDAGNLDDIREFTTPEMFAEICLDIDERKGSGQTTDVLSVEAELLEVVTEGSRHIASVRFHGNIREEKNGPAEAFDEVWNLVKPADGGRGWAVAGIQQLN